MAAFDADTGVISPGGIGFDINCLAGESRILSEHGWHRRISEFEKDWQKQRLRVMNLAEKTAEQAGLAGLMKITPKNRVLKVTTASGRSITATEDHPFLTPDGMRTLAELKPGSRLALYPFEGVEYEDPRPVVLVDRKRLSETDLQFDRGAICKELAKRGLMPLRADSSSMPLLIKILARNMADGTLIFTPKSQYAAFYGRKEDLELIRKDIIALGFRPFPVHARKRKHRISTKYGEMKLEFTEHSFYVGAKSFVLLLHLLGAPLGDKARQAYGVPAWLFGQPLWYKRLFLAAYFGAKLSSEKAMVDLGYSIYTPTLSMNKARELAQNGREFLGQISELLADFGIGTSEPAEVDGYAGARGDMVRLWIAIDGKSESLIRLFEAVGFEYNLEKTRVANAAAVYLHTKHRLVEQGVQVALAAARLREAGARPSEMMEQLENDAANRRFIQEAGARPSEMMEQLENDAANRRFIQRPIYERGETPSKVAQNFERFEAFLAKRTMGLGRSGMVWDEIAEMREVDFNEPVYDFTVAHDDHNFIANGFVVSNCGMRLLVTNLTFKDVQPKLRQLVNRLYERVPAGVGATGFVKISKEEFRKVVEQGAEWCIEKGYGWKEDLERTELLGRADGADVSKISRRAIDRGFNQIGTLGSGNHYLELQVVKEENIFDERLAKAFGIFPEQVVVMFHCGSRGFGHQIATDYLSLFLSVMQSKYGIPILDKELASAPFHSREAQDYFAAMKGAVNMSFANRQVIAHRIREVFSEVFGQPAEKLGLYQVYDVAHNRASLERHRVDGQERELIVHRKGATSSFGPGRGEIPQTWRSIGQPVIIGGSMETGSYLLIGTEEASATWYSTCHGSGRTMSRTRAKHMFKGEKLQKDMEAHGIYVKTVTYSGLAEEAGPAYKNIDEVIDCVHSAGLSRKVVKLIPIGNVKG